jgi:20S proteasome subunit alpha 3
MEAISHAGTCIGILSHEGIVLVSEKKVTSKLLDQSLSTEKIYRISDEVVCCVAGITSDANILIDHARRYAQAYRFTYQEPIPIEQLVVQLCNLKQSYTQYGGLRPFGVSFLYAGWDAFNGFQLYQSDPSGNYGGWLATCIGSNSAAATSMLKQDYPGKDEISLKDAKSLAIKILSKSMDTTTLKGEKLEFATIQLSRGQNDRLITKFYSTEEIDSLIKETNLATNTNPSATAMNISTNNN